MTDQEALECIDQLAQINWWGVSVSRARAISERVNKLHDFILTKEDNIGCLWVHWIYGVHFIPYDTGRLPEYYIDILSTPYTCEIGKIVNATDFVRATFLDPKYTCDPYSYVADGHLNNYRYKFNGVDIAKTYFFISGHNIHPEVYGQSKTFKIIHTISHLFLCFTDIEEAVLFKLSHG